MRSEDLSSPEELLLIAIAEERAGRICSYLSYALAGAAFGELMIAEKIAIEDNKVVVLQPEATGSAVLDWIIDRVRESKPRKLSSWIARLGNNSDLRHTARQSLARRGLVRGIEKPILGFIPHTVYKVTNRFAVENTRRRLLDCLKDIGRASAKDLLELGIAAQVDIGLLGGGDKKQNKAELKLLREGQPAVKAVREVVDNMNAGVSTTTVAVIAASS